MRRARRVDANQPAIVKALRDAGRTVEVLSDVGRGVPDLLVAYHGQVFLLEIKTPGEGLTPREAKWHEKWAPWKAAGGSLRVVYTAQEAISATSVQRMGARAVVG